MLARSVQTASHIALMTRRQAQEWLEYGAKLIRQCFGVVENIVILKVLHECNRK